MAVGKDKDYAARLHAAGEQAGGFAFAGSQVSWNAPRPEEVSAEERAQRREARNNIDNGLSKIQEVLASPNLSDTQRSELMTQKSLLEGMQMQLATGARSHVDVGQVSAIVANVNASVSATAATVSSGGGSGGPVALARAQAEYQRVSETSRSLLRDTEAVFEQRNRQAFGMAHKYGIDVSEEEEKQRDARKREKEAEARGDVSGMLDARIDGVDARISARRKTIAHPGTSKEDKDRELKELEKDMQERQRLEEQRRQQKEAEIKRNDALSAEQKEEDLKRSAGEREKFAADRDAELRDARKSGTSAGIGRDADFHAAMNSSLNKGASNVALKSDAERKNKSEDAMSAEELAASLELTAFVPSENIVTYSPTKTKAANIQESGQKSAQGEDKSPALAQQVAHAPEAVDAAKPLAEKKAESAVADNSNKTAQATRVASASTEAGNVRGS